MKDNLVDIFFVEPIYQTYSMSKSIENKIINNIKTQLSINSYINNYFVNRGNKKTLNKYSINIHKTIIRNSVEQKIIEQKIEFY